MVKTYISWAVKNDFAAIDVNVPLHYTSEQVSQSGISSARVSSHIGQDDGEAVEDAEDEDKIEERRNERKAQVRHLAEYLWENYIE